MSTQAHHTSEELTRYVTQDLPSEQSTALREHLASCLPCSASLAEICSELALMGAVVEQREVSFAARGRFMARLRADAASTAAPVLAPFEARLLSMRPVFTMAGKKKSNIRSRWDIAV